MSDHTRWGRRAGVGGSLAAAAVVAGPVPTVTLVALVLQVLFLAFFLRHFAFAVAALRGVANDLAAPPSLGPEFTPPVTVLVACKNEEAVVEELVRRVLALDYPHDRMQLIVIDDMSTDRTGELLDRVAAVEPRLGCIHRQPGGVTGKSAALNAALPIATGDVIVVFDADHRPERTTLRRLVQHFADPRVGAAQGRCVIGNPGDGLFSRLISIDYLAGYLVNEYGRQAVFGLPAYGGANCAVRASSLRALGGWNLDSVTEDTDLTLRLLLNGERVRFDVRALDREEGVVSLGRYWRQRYRWSRGHQQACRDYRRRLWRAPHLSRLERLETMMFLYVFHLPVAAAGGLLLTALWSLGLLPEVQPLPLFPLWTLLFLGPMLELGVGLLVGEANRRNAAALVMFLPLFFVSIALCTKSWVDGVLGRSYGWAKTARAADSTATTLGAVAP